MTQRRRKVRGDPPHGRGDPPRSALRQAVRGDEGSATVLAPFGVAAMLLLTGVAVAYGAAVAAAHRAQTAADLAALAGAAHPEASGVDGCALAAVVAGRNGAWIVDCRWDGDDVVVRVAVSADLPIVGRGRAQASARAGPDLPQ